MLERQTKDGNETAQNYRKQVIALESEIDELKKERETTHVELKNEINRLTQIHQNTINLLRQENNQLEQKYMRETSGLKQESRTLRDREVELRLMVEDLQNALNKQAAERQSQRSRRYNSEKKRRYKEGSPFGK